MPYKRTYYLSIGSQFDSNYYYYLFRRYPRSMSDLQKKKLMYIDQTSKKLRIELQNVELKINQLRQRDINDYQQIIYIYSLQSKLGQHDVNQKTAYSCYQKLPPEFKQNLQKLSGQLIASGHHILTFQQVLKQMALKAEKKLEQNQQKSQIKEFVSNNQMMMTEEEEIRGPQRKLNIEGGRRRLPKIQQEQFQQGQSIVEQTKERGNVPDTK